MTERRKVTCKKERVSGEMETQRKVNSMEESEKEEGEI